MSNLKIDESMNEVKSLLVNGKNLIGGVVGGNYESTFQQLANNAQAIKTARDNNINEVNSMNSQISSLTSQSSSLNQQLTNMTNDRNNWMNVANSKYEKRSGTFTNVQHANIRFTPVRGDSVLLIRGDSWYSRSVIFFWSYATNSLGMRWFDYYGYYDTWFMGDMNTEWTSNLEDIYIDGYNQQGTYRQQFKGTVHCVPNDAVYFDIYLKDPSVGYWEYFIK